ncbi:MAG: hypothetical protein LQ342_008521 [Letrouitia transgressa]|nr:MAG: hypothetical protein LQ342_008521 [Letrouitia transgressa]
MASFSQNPSEPPKTPTTKLIESFERKASNLLEQPTPLRTAAFLEHQLNIVEIKLELRRAQLLAMSESSTFFNQTNKEKEDFKKEVRQERKRLVTEKTFLLSCHRSLIQDLNDTNLGEDVGLSRQTLVDAYIKELRLALEKASDKIDKTIKVPRWSRKRFANEVHEYLGTNPPREEGAAKKCFCNVIGDWISIADAKVAHIVPWSWDSKAMDYAFGSQEKCLESKRNGLCLQENVEKAFDKCEVTIVPLSVESTPTEWKIIVLKDSIAQNVVYQDSGERGKRVFWRWSDLDGRQLTFLNNNRPARRFLYLRHTLALINAKEKQWLDYPQKVPPGEVWANPDKSEGYLRNSILLDLAKRVGGTLPPDLVAVGGFDDPSTSNPIDDACTREKLAEDIGAHVEADDGEWEESEEDESEDESEEDFQEDLYRILSNR